MFTDGGQKRQTQSNESPAYPWYIDPPPHPWYFDPPTHGILTPYPWYIYGILSPCLSLD
jgi:hypothetical protein